MTFSFCDPYGIKTQAQRVIDRHGERALEYAVWRARDRSIDQTIVGRDYWEAVADEIKRLGGVEEKSRKAGGR